MAGSGDLAAEGVLGAAKCGGRLSRKTGRRSAVGAMGPRCRRPGFLASGDGVFAMTASASRRARWGDSKGADTGERTTRWSLRSRDGRFAVAGGK